MGESARDSQDPTAGTGRVLLAEDNPANRKLALAMLARLGYDADAVANGMEAVEALGAAPYDVVLMDCRMPKLDGFGATAEIRRREDAASRIPIIAMTADAMEGDRQRCLEAGMDDYLPKPVSFESLAATLQRWIPSRRLEPGAMPPDRPPSEPGRGGSDAVLDEPTIAGLRWVGNDQGQDRISGLISVFLRDAEANVRKLRDAVDERDTSLLQEALHTLTGSSATFGAHRLAELCTELKMRSSETLPADVGSALNDIEAELDRVKAALLAEFPPTGDVR